ncbi:MAG: divalent metal cation transporter, partial [Burkholderiales bacterium]|nr:divalent metal cation transporter [Burkholderiales bacterium]
MLADTDAGSVITAAQSGAQWGYKLLLLQVVLIPILFIAQELTVRLGLVTGKGHGELIRETFGFPAALLSVSTMALACIGALVTEFSGMAGIGMLYGVPAWITMLLAAGGLILIVWTGSYRSVERVAMLFGAFELAFLIVAWKAHPSAAEILESARLMPVHHSGFNYLIAANIGAVVMPWMIFYQQSAVIDKGLDEQDLPAARWDTIVGAVATQVVMASVLISVAATGHHDILNTVDEIADSITPVLGETSGKMLFGLGMMGAAMVAAIVV